VNGNMPKQTEIKKIAKRCGVSTQEMSKRVFGKMRKLGWKPKNEGGPTKVWKKRSK